MNIKTISNREQLLIALVAVTLVLGSYLNFRFLPELDRQGRISSQAQATEKKLLKTKIPDQPVDDLDSLMAEINDIEHAMKLQQDEVDALLDRLAPFDSQELKVLISRLARESGIQIRTNEAVKHTPVNQTPSNNKKKKPVIANKEAVVFAETTSWSQRLSPASQFYRPTQRLRIEGSYVAIQKFIYGLEALPWTVGVLNIQIEKQPTLAPQGYPQPLSAELVLSL